MSTKNASHGKSSEADDPDTVEERGEKVAIVIMSRAIQSLEQGIRDAREALAKLQAENEADDDE